MTHLNQIIGAFGERVATRYLLGRGMTLLERNWRCPAGELDLILRDGPALVVCEVKTRRTARFGLPVEAVGPAKVHRVRHLTARWLAASRLRPREVRFDVVSVFRSDAETRVEHLRQAF
jgi:putative endonuclease